MSTAGGNTGFRSQRSFCSFGNYVTTAFFGVVWRSAEALVYPGRSTSALRFGCSRGISREPPGITWNAQPASVHPASPM